MNSISARHDYLFNNTYFNRANSLGSNLFANHIYMNNGGFAIPTIIGNSFSYLIALNSKFSIPKINFIRLYANIGTYPYKEVFQESPFIYEGGLIINIINEKFEIFLPLIYSKEIKDLHNLNNMNSYFQKISFILQLDYLNGFKQMRNIQI